MGALADRIVCELSGPRLTLATLAKSHVLRAPGSLGDKPMSPSWFTVQIGQVLRDAGKLHVPAKGKPPRVQNCQTEDHGGIMDGQDSHVVAS